MRGASFGRNPATVKAPADVAQLVEHFTRNEGVPGSSPGVGSHEASQQPRSCVAKLRSLEDNRCVGGQLERRETVVKRLAVLLSLVFGLAASAVALAPGAGAVTGVTGVCSFPISLEQTRAQGDMDHFPTSGPFTEGFFTGQFFVEITNDLYGNSIDVNASGTVC